MSLAQTVQYSAARHNQLVRDIAALDYVPSALSQHNAYLTDVRDRLRTSDGVIESLKKKTKKEWKEHVELKDSTMRKFGNTLIGRGAKFKERISKEEREFLEAQEREMEEKSVHGKIQQDLKEAEQTHQELTSASERRAQLQKELEDLYESIFRGPTPDIPEEDHLETAVRSADAEYATAQNKLNQEGQALGSLSDALATLQSCMSHLRQAESASGMDMWGVGGAGADMMERSSMNSAQGLASQVDMLINQARRFLPEIRQFPQLQIAKASMTDIYFDNIFSDMKAHEKIQENMIQCRNFIQQLQAEVQRIDSRVASLGDSLMHKQASLERARGELHALRQATVESILSSSGGTSAPAQSSYAPPHGAPPSHGEPPAFPSDPPAFPSEPTARSAPEPSTTSPQPPMEPQPSTNGSFQPSSGPPPGAFQSPSGPPLTGGAFSPPPGPPPSGAGMDHPLFSAPSFPVAENHSAGAQEPGMPARSLSPSQEPQAGVTRQWSSLNPFAARLAARAESARAGANAEIGPAPGMPTPAHEQGSAPSGGAYEEAK